VAFASSIFSPHTSNSLPYGWPATDGEGMRLPRSAYSTTNTICPLCLPVGILPVSDDSKLHPNHPHTFWSKPHSSFGLLRFTAVTSVHLCWP